MIRATCAVLGCLTFLVAVPSVPATSDVDAVTFALAFRARNADAYRNMQVAGAGMSFHGPIEEKLADATTRTSLVMTLGAEAEPGKLTLLKTWDDFVAAERARTTVVIALSGPNLPEGSARGEGTYDFSGVYDGQVRTVVRAPQAADSDVPDPGPCPGEQPRNEAAGRFYCAPLLTAATASLKVGPDR